MSKSPFQFRLGHIFFVVTYLAILLGSFVWMSGLLQGVNLK
jgi:hypothetical protein